MKELVEFIVKSLVDNPENLVSVVKGERVGTIVRGK